MSVEALEGKCNIRMKSDLQSLNLPVIVEHTFFCGYSYDPVTGAIKQVPHLFLFKLGVTVEH